MGLLLLMLRLSVLSLVAVAVYGDTCELDAMGYGTSVPFPVTCHSAFDMRDGAKADGTWTNGPTKSSERWTRARNRQKQPRYPCTAHGTMTLLPPEEANRVTITMSVIKSRKSTLFISDNQRATVTGEADLADGTVEDVSSIELIGGELQIFSSSSRRVFRDKIVASEYTLQIVIGENYVKVTKDHRTLFEDCDSGLFAYFDRLYLGINRGIKTIDGGPVRTTGYGVGACQFCVVWSAQAPLCPIPLHEEEGDECDASLNVRDEEDNDFDDWEGQGVSWANELTPTTGAWADTTRRNGNLKYPCSNNGVLELTPTEGSNSLKLVIRIKKSYRYSIHLSDDPTASGSGLSAAGGNVATVELVGTVLSVFNRHGERLLRRGVYRDNFNLRMEIGQDYLKIYRRRRNIWFHSCDDGLFSFGKLYLAVNRGIHALDGAPFTPADSDNMPRIGHGACDVCVDWRQEQGECPAPAFTEADWDKCAAFVHTRRHTYTSHWSGVSWLQTLTRTRADWSDVMTRDGKAMYTCSDSGVLKLTPPEDSTLVQLRVKVRDAHRYVLLLSQDPAASGDGKAQGEDGETSVPMIQVVGRTLQIFTSDGPLWEKTFPWIDFELKFAIGEYFIRIWGDNKKVFEQCHPGFFGWSDFYLGINRGIHDVGGHPFTPTTEGAMFIERQGNGACRVGIDWLDWNPQCRERLPGDDGKCDAHYNTRREKSRKEDWLGASWAAEIADTSSASLSVKRGRKDVYPCTQNGVMELQPPEGANSVRFTFWLEKRKGFLLHLSNDASAAENGVSASGDPVFSVQYIDKVIKVFDSTGEIASKKVFEGKRLRIFIGENVLKVMKNKRTLIRVCPEGLSFGRLYLGVNRVVGDAEGEPADADDVGSGACNICVDWMDELLQVPCSEQTAVTEAPSTPETESTTLPPTDPEPSSTLAPPEPQPTLPPPEPVEPLPPTDPETCLADFDIRDESFDSVTAAESWEGITWLGGAGLVPSTLGLKKSAFPCTSTGVLVLQPESQDYNQVKIHVNLRWEKDFNIMISQSLGAFGDGKAMIDGQETTVATVQSVKKLLTVYDDQGNELYRKNFDKAKTGYNLHFFIGQDFFMIKKGSSTIAEVPCMGLFKWGEPIYVGLNRALYEVDGSPYTPAGESSREGTGACRGCVLWMTQPGTCEAP